jgi:hypothetical protein
MSLSRPPKRGACASLTAYLIISRPAHPTRPLLRWLLRQLYDLSVSCPIVDPGCVAIVSGAAVCPIKHAGTWNPTGG